MIKRILPVAIVLLSVGFFYRPLFQGGFFAGRDWADVAWDHYDWVRQSVTQYHTPALRMEDAVPVYGNDLRDSLADPQAPVLSLFQWLFLFGISTDAYIRLVILIYAALGCLAMYALLRAVAVPRPVALIFAVLYAESGWLVAHLSAGHANALGAALLPAVLLGLHRAVAGSAVWLGAAAIACMAFEGFCHTSVWAVLFGTTYAVLWSALDRRPRVFWTWCWLLAAAFVIGAARFVPMIAVHGAYVPPDGPPAFTLHQLWTALTANGQSPEMTLVRNWGWWEYACYIGPVGVTLVVVGCCLGRREALPWIGLGLFALALALPTPLFPWLQQRAPLWNTERCPSRFLIVALLAFCVAAASGWARVYGHFPKRFSIIGAAAVFCWLTYDLSSQAQPWLRKALSSSTPLVARTTHGTPGLTTWPGWLGAFLTGIGVALFLRTDTFRRRQSG